MNRIKCPICGSNETKVSDSRPTFMGRAIRRRRRCICGARFTTYEFAELDLDLKEVKEKL